MLRRLLITCACLSLSGCGSLVDNLGDIEKVAQVLSFQPDLNVSGDKYESTFAAALFTEDGDVNYAGKTDAIAIDDDRLQTALDTCKVQKLKSRVQAEALFGLDVAGAIVALGKLVFQQAITEVGNRIKKIKADGIANYSIKGTWADAPEWRRVRCVGMQRILTAKGLKEAQKDAAPGKIVDRVRMTAVLQVHHFGNGDKGGYVVAPIYARVNYAMAQTGAGDAKTGPYVRLQIALILKTIAPDRVLRTSTVAEGLNVSLAAPLKAEIGKPAETKCAALVSKPASARIYEVCDAATPLMAEPLTGTAKQMVLTVTETGTGVSDAEAASASLDAINKALTPTVASTLTQLTAGLPK